MSFEFKENHFKTVKLSIWSNPAYMKANERERMEAFVCEYEDNCPMYEQGKCVCEKFAFWMTKCPHSRYVTNQGLTRRASGFGKAASRWREQYKTEIITENKKLCVCGYVDGVYICAKKLQVNK